MKRRNLLKILGGAIVALFAGFKAKTAAAPKDWAAMMRELTAKRRLDPNERHTFPFPITDIAIEASEHPTRTEVAGWFSKFEDMCDANVSQVRVSIKTAREFLRFGRPFAEIDRRTIAFTDLDDLPKSFYLGEIKFVVEKRRDNMVYVS